MRCIAITRAPHEPGEVPAARAAAARFEGLLFAKALEPVAKAIGFYGELVVGSAVESLAVRSEDAFTRSLAREAERS